MSVKISAVIPAYNEGRNIAGVSEKLKSVFQALKLSYEIIVVNDGSTDDTGSKARECGAIVIEHERNLGYGRSLKDGIRASRGEFILLIDADGTYDIGEVPNMLRLAEDADMVIGKRIFSRKSKDRFKNITRRFFAYLTSYYLDKKIEDLNSGQRVFRRRDIMDELDAFPDGFSFTSTLTVKYASNNKTIAYTPVAYNDRRKESKFISGFHFFPIAKLTFNLVLKNRPFKLIMQLAIVLASAVFLAVTIDMTLHAAFFIGFMFFAVFYIFHFLLLLCYIYAMGRAVTRRA